MTNAISRSWVFNYLHIPGTEWWKTACFYNFLTLSRAMPEPVTAVNSKAGTLLSSAARHTVNTARTKGHHLLGSPPRSQHSHGSQSPQDIHKSKPAPACTQRSPTTPKHARAAAHTTQLYHRARSSPLPHGIRPCFCLKLPMCLYGPVLHQCSDANLCMNYSKVKLVLKTVKYWSDDRLVISPMASLPQMNVKNQEMFRFSFSLNHWKRNVFFLMLHLWAIRSAGSTSAISLSHRKANTGQNGATLGHCPWYGQQSCPPALVSAWCISHLSPSSATAELTRVCDRARPGFQHIRNNTNDIMFCLHYSLVLRK